MTGTVVFDIGSTLIHPDFGALAGWLSSELGIERNPAAVERAFRTAISQDDAYYEGCTFFALIDARWKSDTARCVSAWRRIQIAGGRNSWLYTRLDSNAIPVLTWLRAQRYRIVAASNSDGSLDKELDDFGLLSYFYATWDSGILGHEKPDANFYRNVLMGNPSPYFHVGDDVAKDYIAALANGFHYAFLLDPMGLAVNIPEGDRIIDLSELPSRLETL